MKIKSIRGNIKYNGVVYAEGDVFFMPDNENIKYLLPNIEIVEPPKAEKKEEPKQEPPKEEKEEEPKQEPPKEEKEEKEEKKPKAKRG